MSHDLEKLRKGHKVDDFDCGVSNQNDYLKKYAWQNQQLQYGVTYVAVDEDKGRVDGFYTLAAGNVNFKNLPESFRREGIPKYPAPTVLLAQFGVNKPAQGKGLGKSLLVRALEAALEVSEDIGAVAVEVRAIDEEARAFYEKFGFTQMQDSPDHLFMSMEVVRSLVDETEAETV